ncbi:MAG: NADH:ubiquinone reductase (Na(+)-transporting) subunit B, partial [Burkholderiales bacterium]|nr:NADH:ubiquinone reductase (Na(+)-transporting) subunit B [Burkholderiales bacterium]
MAQFHVSVQPPQVTLSAPHVRDAMSVHTAMNVFMVSLIPSTLMAVYNTGYQANLAMEHLGVSAAPGWRGDFIDFLGIGYNTSELWASIIHGAIYFLPVLLVVIIAGAF